MDKSHVPVILRALILQNRDALMPTLVLGGKSMLAADVSKWQYFSGGTRSQGALLLLKLLCTFNLVFFQGYSQSDLGFKHQGKFLTTFPSTFLY